MSDPTRGAPDPLLPPGLKIGAGRDLDSRPVVRADVRLHGSDSELAIVVTPAEARALYPVLARQADRRVRILAALLLRQADLAEGRHLRVVEQAD